MKGKASDAIPREVRLCGNRMLRVFWLGSPFGRRDRRPFRSRLPTMPRHRSRTDCGEKASEGEAQVNDPTIRMSGVSLIGRLIADEAERRCYRAVQRGETDRAAAAIAAEFLISKAQRPAEVPPGNVLAVYLEMAAKARRELWPAVERRAESLPC